jgi:predicted Zn-dependent protease
MMLKMGGIALVLMMMTGCRSVPPGKAPGKAEFPEEAKTTATLKDLFGHLAPTSQAAQTRPAEGKDRFNEEAVLDYFQAKSSLLEKDQKAAVELLEKSLALDSNYLPAQSLLTQLYFDLGQSQLAEKHARIVLVLEPNDPMANYVLGSTLLNRENFKTACEYLFRAMILWNRSDQEINLEGMLASFKLGGALAGQGYLRAAVEVFEPLLARMEIVAGDQNVKDPRIKRMVQFYQPGLYLLMGEFSLKLGRGKETLEYFRKAERFPNLKNQARMGLIRCYFLNRNPQEARRLLDKVGQEQGLDDQILELYQQLYPGTQWPVKVAEIYKGKSQNLDLGVRIAEQLQKNGNPDLAIRVLREVLRVDPSHNRAFALLIQGYEKSGKIDEAAQVLLDSIIHFGDKSTAIPITLKDIDSKSGHKLVESLKHLKVSAEQEYARNYLLGLAFETAGNFSMAEEFFRISLNLKKDFLPSYLTYGQLLLQRRQWSGASSLMAQAIRENLKTGGILYIQGNALLEQNDIPGAIKVLNEARKMNPSSDQILLALAESYLRSSEPGKAFDLLKQIIGNNLAGPETMSRLVQMLFEADSVPLGESVLQQYGQRFGQDSEYKLLNAKLNYLKDLDPTRYRSELQSLKTSGYQSGSLDREMSELEFNLGNYDQAIRLVREALKANRLISPRDYQRLLQIEAFSDWKKLEYDTSEQIWLKLLAIWPNQVPIQTGLARMYLDAQEYGKAIPLIRKLLALQNDPDQKAQLELWLINSLMGQEDLAGAMKTLDGWITAGNAGPDVPRYLRMKVDCLLREKKYPEAVKLLEGLVVEKKHPVLQWQQMVVTTLLQAHQPEKALTVVEGYLSAGMEKNRRFFEGLKVSVLLEIKKYAQAVELARKMLAQGNPEQRFSTVLLLIDCYQQAKQYDQALDLARKELGQHQANTMFAMTLQQQIAHSLEMAGKYDEAEKMILEQVAKSDPTRRNQWQQLLTALYFSRGKTDPALKMLEKILEANPNLGWANNSLGYSLADKNRDLSRAEKLVRTALTTEPGSPAFLDSLAWVLYRQGKYEQAYQFSRMACRGMNEADPVVLDHLGDICLKLRKLLEAKKYWNLAVQACEGRDASLLEPGMPDRTLHKLKALP